MLRAFLRRLFMDECGVVTMQYYCNIFLRNDLIELSVLALLVYKFSFRGEVKSNVIKQCVRSRDLSLEYKGMNITY